jgi:hypothetical protein
MDIDLPELLPAPVTKGNKNVSKDLDEDLDIFSDVFASQSQYQCSGCGRELQSQRRGGFEVLECPECDKDLDRS